jgi:hypothetical protein
VELPTCYAVEKTGRLILSKTKRDSHDFKGIADTFSQIVEEFVQRAGGALEIDLDYSDNALLKRMKTFVLAQTTAEPAFKPTKDRLTSPEIYAKVIKQDWDGFAQCQWAEGMTGTLALLKYHVENGRGHASGKGSSKTISASGCAPGTTVGLRAAFISSNREKVCSREQPRFLSTDKSVGC